MNSKETRQDNRPAVSGVSAAAVDEFCGLLKVMSNPKRLAILMRLMEGETAVGELESTLGIKQPNLSHELRKLRSENLVSTRRQSKVVFYSIASDDHRMAVRNVVELLTEKQEPHSAGKPDRDCGRFATIT